MKATTMLIGNIILIVLAMQAEARPGTRQGRQDLRMLPVNATGTPQDQALAGGVVPPEAPATTAPPPSPTTPAAADSTSASSSTPASSASSTPVPVRTAEGWRKLPSTGQTTASASTTASSPSSGVSAPIVTPVLGQDRTRGHPGASSDFAGEDSNIVFPSPPVKLDTIPGQPKFDPFARGPSRTPPCAKGSTFCTEIDNYPENYLQTMLRSVSVGLGYKEYFGNDVIAEGNITQRIDANDENPLCPYEETVVYPKVAKNKEDKWLYVVNQDHFVQGVRIETCLNPGTACQLAENFPLGYTTSCRQKYILRKLVALNPEGQTQTDMFRLPSCCSCYVTRSNVSSRRSNMTPAIKMTDRRKR